jgi:hypothetical protein
MYLFFLGPVPLPITPGALTIKTPSLNKTVSLVNDGEINIPKAAGLREISFDFLLPQIQQYPFANYQLKKYTASVLIPLLNTWKNTMLPFRFIVVRRSPKNKPLYFTYIKCVIEDFEYNEDAEAHGLDVMCSINLKEYKDYGTKVIKVKEVKNSDGTTSKTTSTKNSRPSNKQASSSVTTTKETTWPNVAKETTGSFDDWEEIAWENGVDVPDVDVPDVNDEVIEASTKALEEDGVIDTDWASRRLDSIAEQEMRKHEAREYLAYTDPDGVTHPIDPSLTEPVKANTTIITANTYGQAVERSSGSYSIKYANPFGGTPW